MSGTLDEQRQILLRQLAAAGGVADDGATLMLDGQRILQTIGEAVDQLLTRVAFDDPCRGELQALARWKYEIPDLYAAEDDQTAA